jgi:transcription termination factor Rho
LAPLNAVDAMTLVHDWLVKTKTNLEFLQSMNS